jgi:hypothetical protein
VGQLSAFLAVGNCGSIADNSGIVFPQKGGIAMPDATMKKPPAGFLNEEQQAEELGVTVRTIRRWRKDGTGPAFTRNGQQVLYRADWTQQWLEGGKQPPVRAGKQKPVQKSSKKRTETGPQAAAS